MADLKQKTKLFVFGGGGQARMLADIIDHGLYELCAYVLPEENRKLDWTRIPCMSEREFLKNHTTPSTEIAVALAMGENTLRRNVFRKLLPYNFLYPSFIHPAATVSDRAIIKDGAAIMPGAVVNAFAEIGAFAIVNSGAVVEHDSLTGDYSAVAPGGIVCGGCTLGTGAYIGAGATLVHGLTAGAWSVLGAGAVAIESLEPYTVNVGVPARKTGRRSEDDFIL